jgi:hypothetical protein
MIVEVIGLFFQNTMHFVNDACSVWQRQVFEMEGCWKWNVRRCDPDEIRVGAGATAKVGEVVAVIDGDMTAKASVLNAAPAAKTSQWRPPFEEVSTPRFVVNRAPELELAGPRSSRAISSRCQREVGRGRRRRSFRANNGANFNTHRRTIS